MSSNIQPCDIVIENDKIAAIENCAKSNKAEEIIDAKDCYIFPGVIDTHVHFREPGMPDTADIFSESRAAAAGGVPVILICLTIHLLLLP